MSDETSSVEGRPSSIPTRPPPPAHVAVTRPAPRPVVLPRGTRPPRLHYGRLKQADHGYSRWEADIHAGVSIETVQNADYWEHVAEPIKAGDEIRAVSEDNSWIAWFYVLYAEKGEVQLVLKQNINLDAEDTGPIADEYEVDWISKGMKFGVRRKDSKEYIKDHLYSRKAAHQYIINNLLSRSKA